MLSQRGQDFLATLERRPSLAPAEVERLLIDAGLGDNQAWLDFHQRYAGYTLDLGQDVAVLGLAFEAASWLDPRRLGLFRAPGTRAVWGIACADAHPSYEFVLTTAGKFQHAPTARFDVFIEQSACIWFFTAAPKFRGLPHSIIGEDAFRDELLARESLVEIPEASDSFTRVLMDDRYLAFDPELLRPAAATSFASPPAASKTTTATPWSPRCAR